MMEVNWDAVGAIAELAGALGVIITLAYLAIQMRQNSTVMSASLANAHRESANDVTLILASDREALRVFWAGIEDRDALEGLDQKQFDALISIYFATMLQSFQVSDEAGLERIASAVAYRGVRQWWSVYSSTVPADFRAYMNARFETTV